MDIERSLITKIIATGQLETVVSRGVLPEHFADDQCRDMYIHILQHSRKFKSPPSMSMVKEQIKPLTKKDKKFEGWEWSHSQDALEALVEQFIGVVKRRFANDTVLELAAACDDPERSAQIELEFLEASRQLATLVPTTSVSKFSDMDKRIDEYERRVAEGELPGIPTGFPTLDKWTGGIPSHAFVVVSAFSGIGKSTLLKAFAFNFYAQGYNPLYITLEESDDEVLHKFDSMAANLTYQHINQLSLGADALNDWRATAKKIRENVNDINVIDDIRNCTPDNVFAETVRHKPDIVIVDYVQLMHSARASTKGAALWQRITDVTQDLKQNARTLGIPIVAAAQTNRSGGKEGAELDNIGGSISVVQDADMLIGLFADDEMKEQNEMEVRLNKNRRGRLGRFTCIWDHDKIEYRERQSVDVWTRKKKEKEGEPEAPKDKRNPFVRKDEEQKKAA